MHGALQNGQRESEAQDRSWMVPVTRIELHGGLGISGWVSAADVHAIKTSSQHPHPHSNSTTPSDNARVAIGSRHLMEQLGVLFNSEDVSEWLRKEESLQRTGLLVAYDGAIVACLAVEDPIKPEARGVVARLLQQGVRHCNEGCTYALYCDVDRACACSLCWQSWRALEAHAACSHRPSRSGCSQRYHSWLCACTDIVPFGQQGLMFLVGRTSLAATRALIGQASGVHGDGRRRSA
jgi:hypothetical protein